VPFSKVSRLLGKDLVIKLATTKEKKIRVFRGKGCPLCQKTGFLGRVGIFEVLEISDPIAELILKKASASQIREKAKKLGMTTMIEDGMKKVAEGITTIEEVLKTVK